MEGLVKNLLPEKNNENMDIVDENSIPNIPPREFNVEKNTSHWLQVTAICIIKVVISLIAMVLAWNCSARENIVLRLLITLVSGLFGEFYILYFAIYRVFLGNQCYIS